MPGIRDLVTLVELTDLRCWQGAERDIVRTPKPCDENQNIGKSADYKK